jgi:hypothetical protein
MEEMVGFIFSVLLLQENRSITTRKKNAFFIYLKIRIKNHEKAYQNHSMK